MRNPWGREQYIGPWSDNDDKNWTPDFKKQAGFVDDNDGSFFVPAEIFK